MSEPLHATLVARFTSGAWRGVLLQGASGAGKSALALALITRGWALAADDRVVAWASGGRLWGRAPEVLHGLLEVRGAGVVAVPALAVTPIKAVIDCVQPGAEIERIPAPARKTICGIELVAFQLDASSAFAVDKVMAICGGVRV